ncbi:MAG TPA: hypothetical protein VFS12_17230, partial [Terriglobia bacterium]|nr:hypothetical protein [Terriglobia bacterium]
MPRCGATFDENGVAQTAAFGGLRLSVSEARTCRGPAKKTAGPRYAVYLEGVFHAAQAPARFMKTASPLDKGGLQGGF